MSPSLSSTREVRLTFWNIGDSIPYLMNLTKTESFPRFNRDLIFEENRVDCFEFHF